MNSFSYFLDYKFSKSFAETTDVNFGRESVELDSADPREPACQSSMWSEEEQEEKKGRPCFTMDITGFKTVLIHSLFYVEM